MKKLLILKISIICATLFFAALPGHAVQQGEGECFWSDRNDNTCQQTFRDGSFIMTPDNRLCASTPRSEGPNVCCCPKPTATVSPRYIIIGVLVLLLGGGAVLVTVFRKNDQLEQ